MLREAPLKFTRELPGTLTIKRVSADGIQIGDDLYESAIAVSPEEMLGEWPQKPIDDLVAEDFDFLLANDPEIVILGTGATNTFPPRELMFAFARKGVGLEVMDTTAAARTFNVLATEGRRVTTVLYPPGV